MKKILFAILLMALACGASLSAQRRSVSILGDSFSTFEGYVQPITNVVWYHVGGNPESTDVDAVEQMWWYKFLNDNDLELERNNSYSGSTICNTGYDKEDYSKFSFLARMKDLGAPDIIIIFGATNDSWANSPVGEYKYSDWQINDLQDFRPALAYMLDTMKNYYPNAEFYFVMYHNLRPEISNSVHVICQNYGIRVIDLKDIDHHPVNWHPLRKGMEKIAESVTTGIFDVNSEIESIDDNKIAIVVTGNLVNIKNLKEDDTVEVYNINGVCIYRGTDNTLNFKNSGIYFIKVNGNVTKVAVRYME